jgi:predicted metal-dependent peptidase
MKGEIFMLPEKIQAARFLLNKKRPYLATALWALQTIEKEGLGTMAVDKKWRLYYDPEIEKIWETEEIAGVIYHEILHLLRDHPNRLLNYPAEIANIAADAEINDDLLKEKIELPDDPVTPQKINMPEGLLAEEYAEQLMKQNSEILSDLLSNLIKNENKPQPGAGNCGSIATGRKAPWELGDIEEENSSNKEAPGYTDTELEIIRKQIAKDIEEFSQKNPGTVPDYMVRWAKEKLKPKVNWKKELSAAIKNTIATISGMVDYTYNRPSRRQSAAGNVILPSLRQPIPNVAVVIDTSGSISNHMLSQAVAEVDGILKSVGLKEGIKYIACDYDVHVTDKITNVKKLKLQGGGGTNMAQGIKAAAELKPCPDICVVLTDGYTPWPDDPPAKMKIIVGLIKTGNVLPLVPTWAKKIEIESK